MPSCVSLSELRSSELNDLRMGLESFRPTIFEAGSKLERLNEVKWHDLEVPDELQESGSDPDETEPGVSA